MHDLQSLAGYWRIEGGSDVGITHWEIHKDLVTEAGPSSVDPEPKYRIKVDTDTVTLIQLRVLNMSRGRFLLTDETLDLNITTGPMPPMRLHRDARPKFFPERHPEKLDDSLFGVMTWSAVINTWNGQYRLSANAVKIAIGIEETVNFDADRERLHAFLIWLDDNYETFLETAASEAFNYDLIWDESLDETSLKAQLSIAGINLYDSNIRVWFDSGGATTDHQIQTKIGPEYQISEMQI